MQRSVAIVGAGFSGAMLAARLAESGVACALIDRNPAFGLGLAYSTRADVHVLNVRSGRMSALAGEPDHFARWLAARHPTLADPEGFAPRRLYGDYLRDRLERVERACPGRIERIVAEAVAVTDSGVRLADGRVIEARTVVLATGNPSPMTAVGPSQAPVIADPWAPGALDAIQLTDDVLILGTGLTMVDMVLALEERGWIGRALALSRRGLRPRTHAPAHTALAPPPELTRGPLSRRLRAVRKLTQDHGWHEIMEGLRPRTAALWAETGNDQRARFLRHLRPWWDVHRHRIAPGVAAAIDRLQAEGRLELTAGRVLRVAASRPGVSVRWRARGETTERAATAEWLIDCTGPGHAPDREAPTAHMIASGAARLDPLRLGLDVDGESHVRKADGQADDRVIVLGPPARAAFWETTAVPDIRERIEELVARLTA